MPKKPIIIIIVSLLILGAAIVFVTTDFNSSNVIDENKIPNDKNPFPLGNITSFNDAVNQFCFDFFKKLAEDEDNYPNLFYSPYSVFTALAMTYEGARNNTAFEMENVLHIEQDNDSFHEYMHIKLIETYYGGNTSEIEYANPEEAARIINEWVENKTNNLIKNLVPADGRFSLKK